MKSDLSDKTRLLLEQLQSLSENDVRSLMILIRKQLELMGEAERAQYLILNLFCNWVAHTEITQSRTGLRILARVNDALVLNARADTSKVQVEASRAVGFDILRSEFLAFLTNEGIDGRLVSPAGWTAYLLHLIEIIRDVPIAFPPISELKSSARKIYDEIAQTPIKPGAGVVQITLSNVDYDAMRATNIGVKLCLVVRTEDTTTIVIPLAIEVG